MTTALDTRFRALADRLVNQYGTSAVISRETNTFDEVTNMPVVGSPSTFPLAISPPTFAGTSEVDGERVLETDMFCLTPAANDGGTNIANLPLNVEKDTMDFDGHIFKVIACLPIYSGDLVAAYKIHMRR